MNEDIVYLVLYSDGQEIKVLIHLNEQTPEIRNWIKPESDNGQEQ